MIAAAYRRRCAESQFADLAARIGRYDRDRHDLARLERCASRRGVATQCCTLNEHHARLPRCSRLRRAMDPRNPPDDTELAKMTVAQILLDALRRATHGLAVTEHMVTWALDHIEPAHLQGVPPELCRRMFLNPLSMTRCHGTAQRLFRDLTVAGAATRCANPASDVRSAHARKPTAFRIQLEGHSVFIVVRNGEAELLQSFEGKYTLGQNLLHQQSCVDFDCLVHDLNNLRSQEARERLFVEDVAKVHLDEGSEMAPLKADREIWEGSSALVKNRLEPYLALRTQFRLR